MAKTLNELYQLAEQSDVDIYDFRLDYTKSISLMESCGDCRIAIDSTQIKTSAEEKSILGHELGHCVTGSFYNRYSPLDVRQKHENRANKRAALTLIPIDELMDAMENPWCSLYYLAEHFEVTEEFLQKALELYRHEIEIIMAGEEITQG